jgi:hypothetical protein
MLTKTLAIAAMVGLGLALGGGQLHPLPLLDRPSRRPRGRSARHDPVGFAYADGRHPPSSR